MRNSQRPQALDKVQEALPRGLWLVDGDVQKAGTSISFLLPVLTLLEDMDTSALRASCLAPGLQFP